MAVGAAAATVFMLRALKPGREPDDATPLSGQVLQQHWVYGRWALASAIPGWLSGAMFYPLLGHFNGLAEAGKLKALLNLTSPVSQLFVAISLLSLPYASRIYHMDGPSSANRLVWRLTLLYAGGTCLYWAVLIALRAPVVHALYGSKYVVITGLLPWLALGSIFRIAATAQANILRAMQAPKSVCAVYSTAGVAGILVGLPSIWLYGIKGAVLAFVITGATASIVATGTVLRSSARRRALESAARESSISEEEASVL